MKWLALWLILKIMEERVCLDCGKAINGRRDKKFCDDQCRNAYNNRIHQEVSPEMRSINGILKKNRRILEELLPPEGKTKVSAKKLAEAGYNHHYHTHLYKTQAGAVYTYVYEFGLLPLEGDLFLVVKRESGKG